MAADSIAHLTGRLRLAEIADWLAVATVVSLPWSTSATGILLVLLLLALIPTLNWADVRRELLTAAGGLPVLLVALGALGMAWADVSLAERWGGVGTFFKLLVIPLLLVQFRRSGRGYCVFIGFLIACVALLIASCVVAIWPNIHPQLPGNEGVPVKSYIVQSVEFTICAAVLLDLAVERARLRLWGKSAALTVLAFAFLGDIFFIVTGRTALVIIVALILVYGFRHSGWKGVFGAAAAGAVVAAIVWTASPYLRERVSAIYTETESSELQNTSTSSGERVEFWRKSVHFIASAPILGHGTGSITEQFKRAAEGQTGVRATVSTNPHNQTFAVGIQLGLLGIAVLWAMWISQMLLFRGTGLVAWIGLVVVTQNIVGSLFNSFIFDFTEGWLYVFGIGVAGGMALKKRAAQTSATAAP
jgi:O-antigen ligase